MLSNSTDPTHATDQGEWTCVHGQHCAGCALLGVPQAIQLTGKRQHVRDALTNYPELRALDVLEVAPATPTLGYRTRAKLLVSPAGGIGLYARGSHDIVDIPECRVLHPLLARVVATVRLQLSAAEGALSGLDLRLVSDSGSEGALLTLVGQRSDRARLLALAQRLEPTAGLLGIALRLQDGRALQQLEGELEHVLGQREARERLANEVTYHYATYGSFVQGHRGQAAALSEQICRELATRLQGLRGRSILELFAGAGALGLRLCEQGAKVSLVERYGPALEQAQRAAAEQGLTGLAAISGDADEVLRGLLAAGAHFDAVIVNPPRRGLSAGLRAGILALAPRAVIYVSCEPASLARDLADFARQGLSAAHLQPFDMLPLTAAVESFLRLSAAEPASLTVLYEDELLVAVDKPPHLPSVPDPAHAHSLLSRLREQLRLPELNPIHRLDLGTSGVCLFAKRRDAVHALQTRLALGEKHYLALVRGRAHAKGTVRVPLREQGKLREATTRYTRIDSIAGHPLLRVRPEQGRTHQVRKHLASIGHPVLGDSRYGDAKSNRYFEHSHGLDRTFLHAHRVVLPAADGGSALSIEAPLAPDLNAVLASLRAGFRERLP
jgi:23S rRNA (uracil1939-C5)-methyltransferase